MLPNPFFVITCDEIQPIKQSLGRETEMLHHFWHNCIIFLGGVLLALSGPVGAEVLVWQDVANELMSPACPGRTLINCTSGQAEQWRELIRQKVAKGETKEEIIQYFVELRGEEILAAPPKKGFALAAWLLPLFVLLNGVGLIVVLTSRWVRKRPITAGGMPETNPGPMAPDRTAPDVYRDRLRHELEELDG